MPLAWQWERAPDLLVATLLSVTALVVFTARPRNRANQLFTVFLLLVGGNFLAGALVRMVGASYESPNLFLQLGYLFLIFDPAVLAYFVALYPLPVRPLRSPWFPAVFLLAPASLSAVLVFRPDEVILLPAGPWRWAVFAHMSAAYLFCLVRLIRLTAIASTPLLARQLQILLLAFGTALVPRLGLLHIDLGLMAAPTFEDVAVRIAVSGGLLVILALLGIVWARGGSRRLLLLPLGGVASLLAVINAIWLLDANNPTAGLLITSLGYSSRWILFSLLVGVALVRHQLFDYQTRLRESIAAGGLFVFLILVAFGLPTLWETSAEPGPLGGSGADLVAVGLVALGVATAPLFLRGFLARRGPESAKRPEAAPGRLSAYQAVVETLAAEGRLDAARPELRALRANLGITMEHHERIATLVRWQRAASRAGRRKGDPSTGLERFVVERPLGEGTWGQAYLAADRASGRRVVLKRLQGTASGDSKARETLLREARLLSRFESPRIVRLLDVLEEPEPILVLEHVEGGSLEDQLTSAPWSWERALPAFRDILEGLSDIHEGGLLHRDLKPANILLTRDGRAKICDFGIAAPFDPTRTRRSTDPKSVASGTILYMSPEQARGDPMDPRSDLYGVGAILYRLLTGTPHLEMEGLGEAEALRRLAAGPQPPPSRLLGEPSHAFFRKALAGEPGARFRSAADMLGALERLRGSTDAQMDPATDGPRILGRRKDR